MLCCAHVQHLHARLRSAARRACLLACRVLSPALASHQSLSCSACPPPAGGSRAARTPPSSPQATTTRASATATCPSSRCSSATAAPPPSPAWRCATASTRWRRAARQRGCSTRWAACEAGQPHGAALRCGGGEEAGAVSRRRCCAAAASLALPSACVLAWRLRCAANSPLCLLAPATPQVLSTAARTGVPMSGENALQRYDQWAFDKICDSAFGQSVMAGRLEVRAGRAAGGGLWHAQHGCQHQLQQHRQAAGGNGGRCSSTAGVPA